MGGGIGGGGGIGRAVLGGTTVPIYSYFFVYYIMLKLKVNLMCK